MAISKQKTAPRTGTNQTTTINPNDPNFGQFLVVGKELPNGEIITFGSGVGITSLSEARMPNVNADPSEIERVQAYNAMVKLIKEHCAELPEGYMGVTKLNVYVRTMTPKAEDAPCQMELPQMF